MKKKLLILVLCSSALFCKAAGEPDLRRLLDSQINNSVIDIPKGTYLLDLTTSGAYIFSNKKNVIINGNGSTIICNKQNQAFDFRNCENVTFSNLFIEYDPPCASQGTITQLSADKRTWTVQLHLGYPTEGLDLGRILAYGKNTRELKQNMSTLSTQAITKISDNPATVRFQLDGWTNPDKNPIETGDFVSFSVYAPGNTQAHTIIITSCKHMKFDNIVVYDSNCFSFLEYDGVQNHYYRCKVTRKLNDPKYPVDRLRSGIADAFHSKFATIGPIIEECTLEYSGDDCIAINGNFYPVYETNKSEKSISFLTTSNSLSGVYVRKDDRFVCVNNDGSIRGRSAVASISTSNVSAQQRAATFAKLSQVTGAENYTYGVKVYLDTWIEGSATGDVIYSDDRIGAGFKVLRNTVGGNRSRAILIKSSEGMIEGNIIRNSAMSGIAIAPEFYWMEGGCPNNVIIRKNTITNCMFDSDMDWTSQFAALVVVSQAPNGQFAPSGSLNNISIYDNTITDCPFPGVGITSTDGVYFANNTMTESSWKRNHGRSFGVKNTQDLYRVNVTRFSSTVDVNSLADTPSDNQDNSIYMTNGSIHFPILKDGDHAQFDLYDLMGKKLISRSVNPGQDITADFLQQGIYLATIHYNGKNYSTRICK